MMDGAAWWAKGLLFENCNCQLVCPGHLHFRQLCTHERCVGYWAVRFDEGRFEDVPLAGARAVVAYDCPRNMIEGNWTEVVLIDAGGGERQKDAIETILTGRAGGPWEVLARFVSNRLPTRAARIRIEEEDRRKRVVIDGVLEAEVEDIKGRDRSRPVTFENMFNQIHPPTQTLARGTSRYDDGTIRFDNSETHGLYSSFHWQVSAGAGAEK
jgi:hypothetical protein